MEHFNIWYGFVLTVSLLYLFLGIFYLYYSNTKLMHRKGYKEDYIIFLKKDIRNRVIGIAIALPLIMFTAGIITWLILGEFTFSDGPQMLLFFAFFFILILPFPIIDNRNTQKKYKRLAIDSRSELVVDFNYKQLHRIYNPLFEVPSTILYIAFLAYLSQDFHVAFLSYLILWILYFSLRSSRYMVKPSLKDAYTYTFIILAFNQGLLILYLMREVIINKLSLLVFSIGLILSLFLTLKFIYYLIGFFGISKEQARL